MVKRGDPFRDLVNLSEIMSKLLNEDIHTRFSSGTYYQSDWIPHIDLVELDNRFILRADLAGVSRNDISVEIIDRQLILRGERKLKKAEYEEQYHRLERPYGKFVRIFSLPTEVDCNRVSAVFRDGVLEVVLPKSEDEHTKKIPINCEPI